jgi:hypothetical protein
MESKRMCSNEELRVEVLGKIDDADKKFTYLNDELNRRFTMLREEMNGRLDRHAEQIGLASSNSLNSANNSRVSADSSDKALAAVKEIQQMLEDAHVDDAAVIFKGGEKIADGAVWWAKVIAALGLLYASWSHIDWLYWWHVLTNGRPH